MEKVEMLRKFVLVVVLVLASSVTADVIQIYDSGTLPDSSTYNSTTSL